MKNNANMAGQMEMKRAGSAEELEDIEDEELAQAYS